MAPLVVYAVWPVCSQWMLAGCDDGSGSRGQGVVCAALERWSLDMVCSGPVLTTGMGYWVLDGSSQLSSWQLRPGCMPVVRSAWLAMCSLW
jgi:hypothetical protein